MKHKEAPKGKKSLKKEDFLRFHRTGKVDVNPSDYDAFSQAALNGVQYQKENPAVVFSDLEAKLGLPSRDTKYPNSIKILAVAASFLVLLSVGYFISIQSSGISGEELFHAHFSSISYVDSDLKRGTRTGGASAENIRAEAIQAYSAGEHETAESLFQLYLQEENTQDRTARFFYGITLLAQGKVQSAIPIFKDTQNNPPVPGLQRPATYYLALAYLRQNKHDEVIPILQSLTDKEDRYGRDAKKILSSYGF